MRYLMLSWNLKVIYLQSKFNNYILLLLLFIFECLLFCRLPTSYNRELYIRGKYTYTYMMS